ncbi:TPA: CopG family transcriptional regulator [Streptococcus agalactiae]|nr:CopG family transcriptional regulator [Streptococcus agalactiae]
MSPRTGRPKSENPRNVRLEIRITKDEAETLQEVADSLNVSRTTAIVKGIELLKSNKQK